MRFLIMIGIILTGTMATASFGREPRVFSPGVISSGAHDSAPAFSPDGKVLYFGRSTPAASLILTSRLGREGWSLPTVAPFSGRWLDMEPAMSPDGSYIVFVSNRPASPGGAPVDGAANGQSQPGKGGNLWRVDRVRSGGWGQPVHLSSVINSVGSIYAPSIAADGTLFFMKPSVATGRFQLYSAKVSSHGYDAPQPLPFSDGSTTDVDPAVAPDQSFIIFGSSRRPKTDIDLYIAHRGPAGWEKPIYLGDAVNSPTSDAEPRLSPNTKSLYFSSERLAPVAMPIDPAFTKRVASDMSDWNNGLYNIWEVDLAPILALAPDAATGGARRRVETADEAGVKVAEQRWSEAFVAGDAAMLADLLDPDYISVSAKAEGRTRTEVIAAAEKYAAAHPGVSATPLNADVIVRIFSGAAFVRHSGASDRSVDVLRYEGGRWIAVYSQHTGRAETPPAKMH